jgi:serine/threonine-protein kinase
MVPGAPIGVIHAVERALEKDPAARWPDVSSMIEALTGRPLATLDRGPIVASGSETRRSDEAFAHTVASQSGDSDKRGGAATVARPGFGAGTGSGASKPPGNGGFSPTMPAASADLPGPKTPSPAEPTGAPVAPRGSGRAVAIAAGVILGVVAVGVGGWWYGQSRKGGGAARVAEVAVVPATIDAALAPADAEPAAMVTPPPDAAPAPTTPPSRKPAPRTQPPAGDAEPAPEDEGSARAFLDEAAAALKSGDPKEAIRIARRSLNERSTVRAYSLIARAYCRLGDLGNVRAQLPHLPARERKRIVHVCKQAGVDLTP